MHIQNFAILAADLRAVELARQLVDRIAPFTQQPIDATQRQQVLQWLAQWASGIRCRMAEGVEPQEEISALVREVSRAA